MKDLGLLESALATFAREAMSVDADGFVTVEFDSGASTSIGRLALARFANEDELKMDDTLGGWRERLARPTAIRQCAEPRSRRLGVGSRVAVATIRPDLAPHGFVQARRHGCTPGPLVLPWR